LDHLGHVLIRSDLNVPIIEGRVLDNYRIKKALEHFNDIEKFSKSVTYISHLGRPKIEDVTSNDALSLEPIALEMSNILNKKVDFIPHIPNKTTEQHDLEGNTDVHTGINLLENLRFHEGEVSNDSFFAEKLARDYDTYIMDAFGASHRGHASIISVGEYINSYQGPLMTKEINELNKVLHNTDDGYTILLGGSKISEKLDLVENLLPKVTNLLIGGGMCFTFLKALNYEIGNSLCEEDFVVRAKQLLDSKDGSKIVLPVDFGVTLSLEDGKRGKVKLKNFQKNHIGIDIGEETVQEFKNILYNSKTVFWNGPMGIFEQERFSFGTKEMTDIISNLDAYTIVGGGDSVSAINKFSNMEKFNHVSTGGGASIEYLEGKQLPGVNKYPPLII
jgi:3-phosphoglycerate kinase